MLGRNGYPRAMDGAKLFLYWANKEGDVITNLKMQKLLYYAQAWHLVNYNRRLFQEPIEAWNLGPVIPCVYREFKKFGPRPIEYSDKEGKECNCFPRAQLKYLRQFYEIFIAYPAHVLVSASHNEDPWKLAHESNTPINTAAMKDFYSKQLASSRKR